MSPGDLESNQVRGRVFRHAFQCLVSACIESGVG